MRLAPGSGVATLGLLTASALCCASAPVQGAPGPLPWRIGPRGFAVTVHATGFQLPVNIAFPPEPGDSPDDVFYYVTELYGTIKVVTRDGTVSDFATDLLNFNPTGEFPGSGERGLAGVAVHPLSGDVFASLVYRQNPEDDASPFFPKVIRIPALDDGRTGGSPVIVLDMPGETQGESHQISHLSFGPDGKLYVHNGDGFFHPAALDPDSFRGKILRMDDDGKAASDNPFHNPSDGLTARDYVWALGFRNAFGGVWRLEEQAHYSVENGPRTDRLARITAGESYGWAGRDTDMFVNALYNWIPAHAPVNIAFIERSLFDGSGFPTHLQGRAYVTESGQPWSSGPQEHGKRISEFVIEPGAGVIGGPCPLIEYTGTGKATVIALAAGPDGLYFSDFYKDDDDISPVTRGSNVLRIAFKGAVDFETDVTYGTPPLTVHFEDTSSLPGITSHTWYFGDGSVAEGETVSHKYTTPGIHDVTLTVTTQTGTEIHTKPGLITVGELRGLHGLYYSGKNFCCPVLSRLDPGVDFGWGRSSPHPSLGPDDFSVRWTGFVTPPVSGEWTFTTRTDDGVRLLINDQLLIDRFESQAATEYSATVSLPAGVPVPIVMEYFESRVDAEARLFWETDGLPREIIPADRLAPPLPASTEAWTLE